jgi:zinc protease
VSGGGASPLIPVDSVRRVRLQNGLTVLIRRDASAPVVAIVTHVKAGYFDETDDVGGISHVLEHMFFKGTPTRGVGEIPRETKAAGGYLNAGTIYDQTSYYTVLPSAAFVRGLEIQCDAYAHSLIDAGELKRELEVIIQEAKRKEDNPSAVAVESLYALLHDRHRMRRWRIGREEGLRKLTRDDVLRFYRNYYRPGNTILSIVGDIDVNAAAREVERLYGPLTDAPVQHAAGPAEPDHDDLRFREMAGDIAQTQLVIGWRTPGTLHEDTVLLDLAATMLGAGRASRLYRAVRERRLVASIGASNYTPTQLGVFTIHAEGPPSSAADAAGEAWAQLAAMRDVGVHPTELERARRVIESQWLRRLETMEGQATYLAGWEALGAWTLGGAYFAGLLGAGADQVTGAMQRHLTNERAGVIFYRPRNAPPVAADLDALRAIFDGARAQPVVAPAPAPEAPALHLSAAALEREEGGVRVYRTAAGVPVLVKRRAGAPLVHLGVFAAGGASDESEEAAGLTTLVARTAVKGTSHRRAEQIAEEAESLGGSIGAHVGAEQLGWTISVPSQHADAAMALLADVVLNANFPAGALETERAVAIADLALMRDDMYRWPMRLLTAAAFAGHPYGTPSGGYEHTLAALDAGRLRAWHRVRVLSGATAIAIVGDVDADDAAARAAALFTGLSTGKASAIAAPLWPARPVTVSEDRDKAQTALALAFPGPDRQDDARWAAEMIAGVASGLGGRFFEELRDKKSLAYTVHAHASERRRAGMFVSYIATSPAQEETARRGLMREFARLREADVTERELRLAQEYAIGTHAIRQQSGGAVLGELIDAFMMGRGLAELDEHDARIRAVTAKAMREVAKTYFDEGRLVQAVIRGNSKGASGN